VEGQGLKQANRVFGYTRLMVATFGLGGGMAALEKAVAYSKIRVQFGGPLCEKQGYTHRLLVPHAVRLEAARAYIEKTARRLDSGEEDLQTEGSIAKYFATEAGDAAANDAIQAFGGYGYTREYEVEKIKRDIKITTIFEGTSEIQRNIIAMFRMRETVRSKGGYYRNMAEALDRMPDPCGARILAPAIRALGEIILKARAAKLTRSQHVIFLLADMMTWAEVGEAFCEKVAGYEGGQRSRAFMEAAARIFAREAAEKVYTHGLKIACGCDAAMGDASMMLESVRIGESLCGYLEDMDVLAKELAQ